MITRLTVGRASDVSLNMASTVGSSCAATPKVVHRPALTRAPRAHEIEKRTNAPRASGSPPLPLFHPRPRYYPQKFAQAQRMRVQPIHVIGGGLAGSEAAWQIVARGVPVVLHEMRPVATTAAHKTDGLAE